MAATVARGIMAVSHSSTVVASIAYSASPVGSSPLRYGFFVRFPIAGKDGNCGRGSSVSGDRRFCGIVNGSGAYSGGRRKKLDRSVFSMAAAPSDASQTLTMEEDVEYRIQEQILSHQKSAAKLSRLDEARTLANATTLGTLSTISKKYDGFPVGSMVTYAADVDGSIILSISTLSPHTRDLEENPKCSLLVPKDPNDKTDTIITIIGEAHRVSEQDEAGARATYLKRHPGAFWVDFGDFRFIRIQPVKVRYVSGLATGLAAVADFTGEQFQAGSVDPISQFASPIAGHMNRDHSDQTAQIVENSVGVKMDNALILDVDRFGFSVLAKRQNKSQKLRIPFPRPAEDRKDVKTLIIEMLKPKTSEDK